jgi:predicted nucleic acid-binding protein
MPPRGLLDTSVVIDLERIPVDQLPTEAAVSALTVAELAAGPHATTDGNERARRQDRLQRVEAVFEPIPVGVEAARSYGRVFAATSAAARSVRGVRAVDLLLAATAVAEGLPLFTRNPADFAHLEGIVEVVSV